MRPFPTTACRHGRVPSPWSSPPHSDPERGGLRSCENGLQAAHPVTQGRAGAGYVQPDKPLAGIAVKGAGIDQEPGPIGQFLGDLAGTPLQGTAIDPGEIGRLLLGEREYGQFPIQEIGEREKIFPDIGVERVEPGLTVVKGGNRRRDREGIDVADLVDVEGLVDARASADRRRRCWRSGARRY